MAVSTHILLTGAGFTANFGTPLASQVHNLICNHGSICSDPQLKSHAERQADFEQLYNEVINGLCPNSQKDAIHDAVFSAYTTIDNILKYHHSPSDSGLSVLRVQEFIACFQGRNGQTGVYFTLNQDLFLERHQYNRVRPVLPGIHAPIAWFQPYAVEADAAAFSTQLPDANRVARLKPLSTASFPLAYVKLHGSFNWLSTGSSRRMVIGTDKTGQIAAEPLLAWNLEQFRTVLHEGSIKLLSIGYGFRDQHVNAIISDAIKTGLIPKSGTVVMPQPCQRSDSDG